MTLPVLLSIPHGSTRIPPDASSRVRATSDEIFDDGDPFTASIYDLGSAVLHVVEAQVARAVVDLNRVPDDLPPSNPDGVVKSATCHGAPVWIDGAWEDDEFVGALLDRYYTPYHRRLEVLAADPEVVLGIDCHSMNPRPPLVAPDRRKRPAFCLSNQHGATCDDTVLRRLGASLAEAFDLHMSEIGLNDPFAGGYICGRHGGRPLPWVQLEMNRGLYLTDPWYDAKTRLLAPERVADIQRRLVDALTAAMEPVS